MRDWTELLREQRNGFEVIVDKTWEDIPLDHLFDTSICLLYTSDAADE